MNEWLHVCKIWAEMLYDILKQFEKVTQLFRLFAHQ